MLTQEDLKKIGDVVDQKLDEKLELHTETILSVVKKGFDGVDERFDAMETRFDAKLAAQKHELMDHTDRTVAKAVGDLRVELKGDIGSLRTELRERDLIG